MAVAVTTTPYGVGTWGIAWFPAMRTVGGLFVGLIRAVFRIIGYGWFFILLLTTLICLVRGQFYGAGLAAFLASLCIRKRR